ncbi:MAG TPA: hypothetical protein VKU19_40375 [Bryobacteraceae bacterium]|nr:hypothetical protein [Bryobacteraceae bacterium]
MRHHQSFALAAALLLPACCTSFAQCSLATVRGTWGYQIRGTAMMSVSGSSDPAPVPFAGIGIGNIDWQGRYTVHATISAGGQVQDVDFSGSIQVNPDCTATDTYTFGTVQGADRLIILDNGNEMRLMPTKFPLGPSAAIGYLRRLSWSDAQCTSDMVRGSYGGSREGTVMMPVPGQSQPVPTPFSAVHTGTFASSGGGTAASIASMGGTIVEFQFPNISMQVNPDCTATIKYTGTSEQFPGLTFTGAVKYVVLNYGNELIGLETESNGAFPIVLENMKRISIQ